MRVLFDTNVVLDVLLERQPYADVATRLFALVDNGRLDGVVGATTLTTIHDLARKTLGTRKASEIISGLLDLFDVAPVDGSILRSACGLDFADYEDAVLHEAAVAAGALAIVTRNQADSVRSSLPVLGPAELLAAIAAGTG
jgi:predicted nucleic acid-binding protein